MTQKSRTTGSFTGSLEQLYRLGVVCKTAVDVGCADGHFSLSHYPFFPGAVLINIDPNPIYAPSLKAIADVMGGAYFTTAVTDMVGEVELTTAAHPYWASIRPEGDVYWQGMNNLHAGKERVKSVTLDAIAEHIPLFPPYLLKLDVQGAEESVLRGGAEFLRETDVIICEADLGDFRRLDTILDKAGFDLFDLTQLERREDDTLAWFYPVYVNRRRELGPRQIWSAGRNDQVIEIQNDRRKTILKMNEELLAFYRSQRA